MIGITSGLRLRPPRKVYLRPPAHTTQAAYIPVQCVYIYITFLCILATFDIMVCTAYFEPILVLIPSYRGNIFRFSLRKLCYSCNCFQCNYSLTTNQSGQQLYVCQIVFFHKNTSTHLPTTTSLRLLCNQVC